MLSLSTDLVIVVARLLADGGQVEGRIAENYTSLEARKLRLGQTQRQARHGREVRVAGGVQRGVRCGL